MGRKNKGKKAQESENQNTAPVAKVMETQTDEIPAAEQQQ